MKALKLIPVCIAAMAVILVQAQQPPSSQSEEAAAAAKAEKKARKKAKKAAKETGDMTGKSAVPGETTGTTGATGMTGMGTPQAPEAPAHRKARTATTGSAQRAVPTVSESEIASAKASGKVWVNTETGVYHKGGRWFGATKRGKFMTEQEAIAAGYRASKEK